MYKLFMTTLNKAIMKRYVPHPAQAGFRPDSTTLQHTSRLHELLHHCRPGTLLFVDLQKAFDSVHVPTLLDVMTHMGHDPCIVQHLRAIYQPTTCCHYTYNTACPPLTVSHNGTGVCQGCPLSPTLFLLYFDLLLHQLEKAVPGVPAIGPGGNRVFTDCGLLAFADDLATLQQDLTRDPSGAPLAATLTTLINTLRSLGLTS